MRLYYIATMSEISLGTPPIFAISVMMKSSLPAYNIVGGGGGEGLGWEWRWGWGERIPYSKNVIRYCFPNTLPTHFLTDPGVPMTFVEDYRSCEYKATLIMLWRDSQTLSPKHSNASNATQSFVFVFLGCMENVNQSFGQLDITYPNTYCYWIIGNAGIPQAVAIISINQMNFNHGRYIRRCFLFLFSLPAL